MFYSFYFVLKFNTEESSMTLTYSGRKATPETNETYEKETNCKDLQKMSHPY
jgi:hypothetical protein